MWSKKYKQVLQKKCKKECYFFFNLSYYSLLPVVKLSLLSSFEIRRQTGVEFLLSAYSDVFSSVLCQRSQHSLCKQETNRWGREERRLQKTTKEQDRRKLSDREWGKWRVNDEGSSHLSDSLCAGYSWAERHAANTTTWEQLHSFKPGLAS